jgi:hypothetical protein
MSHVFKKEIKILHETWDYQKARFWFGPIVTGVTVLFGIFAGINGAFIGFFYGIVAGLFLIHESLPVSKKVR